jgi:hypothetical protein
VSVHTLGGLAAVKAGRRLASLHESDITLTILNRVLERLLFVINDINHDRTGE